QRQSHHQRRPRLYRAPRRHRGAGDRNRAAAVMTTWSTRFATCFGVGRAPFASGTVASAVALPFGFGLVLLGWQAVVIAGAAATMLGIWACGAHAKSVGIMDPS